eukprot:361726-Chlamydomonas_euryale.AAC.2
MPPAQIAGRPIRAESASTCNMQHCWGRCSSVAAKASCHPSKLVFYSSVFAEPHRATQTCAEHSRQATQARQEQHRRRNSHAGDVGAMQTVQEARRRRRSLEQLPLPAVPDQAPTRAVGAPSQL